MSQTLLDLVRSLTAILEEETALLSRGDWPPDVGALAGAKLRLIGTLEARIAEQERTAPNWLEDSAGTAGPLGEAVARMRDAAAVNAATLERQIDLSHELLHEIAREAQRLGGTRQQTYQRGGRIQRRDGPAAIAVNTQL